MPRRGSGETAGKALGPRAGDSLVRSVERGARIMEALFLAPAGRQLTELSAEVGLHKTTALRLVRTLEQLGVLERDPATERYRWEPLRWLALVLAAQRGQQQVSQRVQQLLGRVSRATEGTAVLAVPDITGRRMLCAAATLPAQPLRVDPFARPAAPMQVLATGKVWLASLPEDDLERWLQGRLPRHTPQTITSPAELSRELERVRRCGYATAREEFVPGASGLAVPLQITGGRVVAAVGVTVPAALLTRGAERRWLPVLRVAARNLAGLLYPAPGTGAAAKAEGAPTAVVPQNETRLRSTYRVI